jgi:hypothetical protein
MRTAVPRSAVPPRRAKGQGRFLQAFRYGASSHQAFRLPLPDPDRLLPLGAGDEPSVRAEGYAGDRAIVLNVGELTPAGDVPHSCRSIGTRGGEITAVRTEGDGDSTSRLREPRDFLSRSPVPDANETLSATGGHERSTGTEVRALEIELPLEPRDLATGA